MAKKYRENEDVREGLRRLLRAYVNGRVGSDLAELPEAIKLHDEFGQWITDAVAELRNDGEHSWGQLADELGVTRQAAQKRWGHVGGSRKPGGQPAHLR